MRRTGLGKFAQAWTKKADLKMKHKGWLYMIVVWALLVAAVMGQMPLSAPALAHEAAAEGPTTTTEAANPLYPDNLDPPETCGVPLKGPFGKDEEVFLGPWWNPPFHYTPAGQSIAHQPDWGSKASLPMLLYGISPWPCSQVTSNVAAVPVGTERIVAVYRAKCGPFDSFHGLVYATWTTSDEWEGEYMGVKMPMATSLGLVGTGNPGIVSRHPTHWEVYARDGNQIKYRTWQNGTLSGWKIVPGVHNAAGDPVVVSKNRQHTALFYRDAGGVVWFTEKLEESPMEEESWEAWREPPLPLQRLKVFLPLVLKNSPGASPLLGAEVGHSGAAPSTPQPTNFRRELSAASRNENHLAVFGVDANGQLWVREWTNLNESEWSDTQWVKLMDGVALQKPGVASRHTNHLAVAVTDYSGTTHYIEWTPASGWKAPEALPSNLAPSVTLAATSVDALSVFGLGTGGGLWQKAWTEDGGWSGWDKIASGIDVDPVQMLSAAVRRIGDVMLLGRDDSKFGVYKHYTSQGQPLSSSEVVPSGTEGYPRGQTLAWVDGKTFWVTANQAADATHWKVDAREIDGAATGSLVLSNHTFKASGGPYASLDAGDMDGDGNDEVVVATTSVLLVSTDPFQIRYWTSISVLDLDASGAMSSLASVTPVDGATAAFVTPSISAAIGDLDGDGVRNEVVVWYGDPTTAGTKLSAYEYNGTLTLLGSQSIASYLDVEVATGRMYDDLPDFPGDEIVLFAEPNDADCRYWAWTYHLKSSPEELELIGQIEVHSSVPNSCTSIDGYDVALDTGDVDADGWDEAVVSARAEVTVLDLHTGGKSSGYLGAIARTGRSLAVGDIDLDGRAEIAVFVKDNAASTDGDDRLSLWEVMDDGTLYQSGLNNYGFLTERGTVLVGDLDNDGMRSELAGCQPFDEVRVVAVVNGAPRYYDASGEPGHNSEGTYSKESETSSESWNGTTYKRGASVSVGFEAEFNVPLVATKLGEVRASVTQDFMATQGVSESREDVEVYGTGYSFQEKALGMAIYQAQSYMCYFYDIYSPEWTEPVSRAMVCEQEEGNPTIVGHRQLGTCGGCWDDPTFKTLAGLSWVPVGHRAPSGDPSNNVETPQNYERTLPVDPFAVAFIWPGPDDPYLEGFLASPGPGDVSTFWWHDSGQGGSRTQIAELEENTTVSAGATAFGVTLDASGTFGMGWQSSETLSWNEMLSFAGGIYQFPYGAGPCYRIVPFAYQATARTVVGATYPYWEMDYYVPWRGPCGLAIEPD